MAEPKNACKHLFRWSGAATTVIVTGTFDNWTKTTQLERKPNGTFEKELELPSGKTLYKYFIDGQWALDPNAPQEVNQSKIVNNILILEGGQSDEDDVSVSETNEPITPSQLMGVNDGETGGGASSKKKRQGEDKIVDI
ncbi:hypothetical protein KEM56_001067 [Ascosphaera pollenicola]|nr:hypothetical protein KEM56_001067 [Ascosphaera pollenicola]